MSTIVAGILFMALGLGTVALANNLFQLYITLFFFSLGTVLVMPNTQTVTTAMADERARGAYFGVGSLALAVGGAMGHIIGGLLMDTAAQTGMSALPWIVFGVVGAASAAGLAVFIWWQNHRLPAVVQPVAAAGD
jgi:DHA1 family multidrug resistance protein-like MFS transporter